jgi:hypothetical protein
MEKLIVGFDGSGGKPDLAFGPMRDSFGPSR